MAPPVTSGLVVQFDAGTIAQADNTAVSSWAPASGSETAAAAQGTAGQRPTFRTGRINSLPAVVFVAANSTCLDTGAWGVSQPVPNTAFVVAKITNGGSGSAANIFTGRTGVLNYIGQENALIQIGAGAGNQLTFAHTPDATFHIYGAVYNGASSAIYYDSPTAAATGSTGVGNANDNMPGMRIGSTSSGAANFPDGDIAEILFYDRALSAGEITTTMSYLNTKYALGLAGFGVTGTAAAPLGALTGAATGTRKVLGTAAAPLGSLAGTATGTRKVLGAAASSLGGLAAAATGTPKVLGVAAAPLGALAGAASGLRTVIGAAAAPLGGLTATAASAAVVTGTASASLGALSAVAHGPVGAVVRYRASGPSRNTRWAGATPTRPERWRVGALPLTDVFTSIYATVYGRH